MAELTSAAVISGELILGLSDGTIIRAGYVQGPPGLQGERGPIGATGRPGTDGNTIHSSNGRPTPDLGRDGDFCIDRVNWEIFHKESGTWGKGQPLLVGGQLGGLDQGGKRVTGAPRFFPMGGASSGVYPPPTATSGVQAIIGHNQPLGAGTLTVIASDTTGDAMHVLIKADTATGSWYGEIVATHFNGNPDHTVAWEIPIGTAPHLTFTPQWNVDHLELAVMSNVALINLRGRVIFV